MTTKERTVSINDLQVMVEDLNLLFYDLALAKESAEYQSAKSKLAGVILEFTMKWKTYIEEEANHGDHNGRPRKNQR